jgi:hypothetical protein
MGDSVSDERPGTTRYETGQFRNFFKIFDGSEPVLVLYLIEDVVFARRRHDGAVSQYEKEHLDASAIQADRRTDHHRRRYLRHRFAN